MNKSRKAASATCSMMQQYRHVKAEKKDATFPPSASPVEKSEYCGVKAGPLSPKSGALTPLTISSLNPKAEALAEAHRGRVEAEATAYLDSQSRKLEAKAHKLQAKAERQRMHEEGKALEARKREDVKAEQLLQIAEWKAEIEETKRKEVAELTERVHMMIAVGELASAQNNNKGVVTKMKQSWACHP
ncbi:hypothetical protein SUGI_0051090 [Cryptomeria japonica]|nr:hypothetical protein SUGI_0051090 [Cryptomeria japonica]